MLLNNLQVSLETMNSSKGKPYDYIIIKNKVNNKEYRIYDFNAVNSIKLLLLQLDKIQ